jgi:hypothetical protein
MKDYCENFGCTKVAHEYHAGVELVQCESCYAFATKACAMAAKVDGDRIDKLRAACKALVNAIDDDGGSDFRAIDNAYDLAREALDS